MARKKELFLIIDTETANTLEQPLCYDISYAICDREGKIYLERSYVVAEIFLNNKELMTSAYYAEKIPYYWENIKNGSFSLQSIYKIKKQINEDIKKYNIRKIGAYNMGFDKRALNNTIRYGTQSRLRWFFPFGVNYICIWNMACQVVLNRMSYIKFALQNGLVSEKDNILTDAESCYKFLKQQIDFVESHTGLEDVRIEIEILAKCFKAHKKLDTKIYTACWRLPQKARKEMELKKLFKK